jgi:hypothetical protein
MLADGHELLVAGHSQLAPAVATSGLRFRAFQFARQWTPVVAKPGIRSMLGWLGLASDRGIRRDVKAVLKDWPASIVVVDCMIPAALKAARESGASVVVLMHAFSGYWISQWSASSPMGAWLRLTGSHPDSHRSDLAIVTTAPELDAIDQTRIPAARTVQVGPIVSAKPSEQPQTDVLLSFSTISYPRQDLAMQATLDALATLPVTAFATIATSLDVNSLRIPANVKALGYVPHAALLPRVRLLVGHGGHGTTMAALAHGVPVLVMAMSSHADQPLVGQAVQAAGVGKSLHREASVEAIRAAIEELLNTEAYDERARELAKKWWGHDAAAAAAQAIGALSFADPSPQSGTPATRPTLRPR